jgi:hypothetical protein
MTIGMTSKLDENMGMTREQLSKLRISWEHENEHWNLLVICNLLV